MTSQIIGKKTGRSAVAAAAYRSATKLYSKSSAIHFDFTRRKGVAFSEILSPDNAPAWVKERETLWNTVEALEKRKDGQYCREIEIALPKELTLEQNKDLVKEFIIDQFIARGMIADYSLHDVNTQNPHCHILLTLRKITEKGFEGKERSWNDRELYKTFREEWANITNQYLALQGHETTIDHRSYQEQGIDLQPTIHMGIQRKDRTTQERFQRQQSIKKLNAEKIIANPSIAIDLLSRHQAVFTHQDIALLANTHSNTPEEFSAVRNAIQYHSQIVPLGIGADGKEYFTTQQTLDSENEFLRVSDYLIAQTNHVIAEKEVGFVCQDKSLNDGQQRAFKHILEGNDLSIMVGFAGTGKSYLINVLREAYEAQDYQVKGAALSGKVADSLQKDTQIKSHTIARYLLDWENERQKLDYRSVFIVDEAGMVGTRQFLCLLKEAHRAKAKIIVIGDAEQLQPIEAGNPFRLLNERHPKTTLNEIIRQKTDWQKEATIELSTQKTALALQRYQNAGFIHRYKNRTEAKQALMEKWMRDEQYYASSTQLILTYSNRDVLALNHQARELLKEAGKLSREAKLSLKVNTERFGELEFTLNDRIMFLQNDNGMKVKNGALGRVVYVGKNSLTVKMDEGKEIWFDTALYSHLTHGYAATVHKSQGATVNRSYVLATRRFDRFLANVSMDRHTDEVNLFYGADEFGDYQALSHHLSQGQDKIMAIEFAQARGMEYPLNQDVGGQQQQQMYEKQRGTDDALTQRTLSLIEEFCQQQDSFNQAMDQKMYYLGENKEKTRYYADLAAKSRTACNRLAVEIAQQEDIKLLYQQLTTEQLIVMPKFGQSELGELIQKIKTGTIDQQAIANMARYFQHTAKALHHAHQLSRSQDEGWSY